MFWPPSRRRGPSRRRSLSQARGPLRRPRGSERHTDDGENTRATTRCMRATTRCKVARRVLGLQCRPTSKQASQARGTAAQARQAGPEQRQPGRQQARKTAPCPSPAGAVGLGWGAEVQRVNLAAANPITKTLKFRFQSLQLPSAWESAYPSAWESAQDRNFPPPGNWQKEKLNTASSVNRHVPPPGNRLGNANSSNRNFERPQLSNRGNHRDDDRDQPAHPLPASTQLALTLLPLCCCFFLCCR